VLLELYYEKAAFVKVGTKIRTKHTLRVIDNISKSLTIYCDNKTVVFFSHNNKSSRVVKYIDLRYLVIRERVQDHTINLEHIGTKEKLMDPLTKDLPPHIFEKQVVGIGLLERL
jgi:hypothetical protein